MKKNLKPAFIQAFIAKMCNITQACEAVHIGRETFYRWQKEDKKFATEVENAQARLIDIAESSLFKNCQAGKEVSLIFFLTNRAPERWKDRRAVAVSGGIATMEVQNLKQLLELTRGGNGGAPAGNGKKQKRNGQS